MCSKGATNHGIISRQEEHFSIDIRLQEYHLAFWNNKNNLFKKFADLQHTRPVEDPLIHSYSDIEQESSL